MGCFFPCEQPFICCKMIQITLKDGMCSKGMMALTTFACVSCQSSSDLLKKIDAFCKIGKLGMHILEKYDPSEVLDVRARCILTYFSLVAPFTVPLQTCANKLKEGLQTGLSSGDFISAFMCIIQYVRLSILAGSHEQPNNKLGNLFLGKIANQCAWLLGAFH